jgi:Fe(3+) dicitrate transport protein
MSLMDARYTEYETTNASANVVNLDGKWVENAPAIIQRINIAYNYGPIGFTLLHSRVSETYATATNVPFAANGTSGKIPGYEVWDLSMKYQINKLLYISCSVNNLTNSKYFTRRATGYPGPGILPSEGRTGFITLGLNL